MLDVTGCRKTQVSDCTGSTVFHNRLYVLGLIRHISLVEQDLLILLEQMGSSSVFSRAYSVLSTIVCPFVTFRFAIILFVCR